MELDGNMVTDLHNRFCRKVKWNMSDFTYKMKEIYGQVQW